MRIALGEACGRVRICELAAVRVRPEAERQQNVEDARAAGGDAITM